MRHLMPKEQVEKGIIRPIRIGLKIVFSGSSLYRDSNDTQQHYPIRKNDEVITIMKTNNNIIQARITLFKG
jgi:hypothetical protein